MEEITGETPPSIHNLGHLVKLAELTPSEQMNRFFGELSNLSLETVSTLDDRVGLNYLYRQQAGFGWTAFTNELNQLSGTAKVEIYVS